MGLICAMIMEIVVAVMGDKTLGFFITDEEVRVLGIVSYDSPLVPLA
jgi:hypothetical protein